MHSLVCTASGALYTFGYGVANQLGHGVRQNEPLPRRVEAPAGVSIVGAAGGEHHSLVIDDAGADWYEKSSGFFAWGSLATGLDETRTVAVAQPVEELRGGLRVLHLPLEEDLAKMRRRVWPARDAGP